MSDARASTPRLSRSTRIAHCPAPINPQPLCRGARPIGIMKKPDEVTIIPEEVTIIPEGSRYQPGTLMGVGPGPCVLPSTPSMRSSQIFPSTRLDENELSVRTLQEGNNPLPQSLRLRYHLGSWGKQGPGT